MIHQTVKLSLPGSQDYARLTTYFLDRSPELSFGPRPVVIICPGGAYQMTSDRESEPVALRLNAYGIHAAALRYSVAPSVFPAALLELAACVRYVREEALAYDLDPAAVFTMGFSAGGHLAASYGCFWNESFVAKALELTPAYAVPGSSAAKEASEILRPNGQILCYPVISSGPFAHEGSFKNLLGNAYETDKEKVSLENHVTENTPPTFIWHTGADPAVPAENSLLFVNALRKHHIKTEFHLYPEGTHGLSLADDSANAALEVIDPHVATWSDLAVHFIKSL